MSDCIDLEKCDTAHSSPGSAGTIGEAGQAEHASDLNATRDGQVKEESMYALRVIVDDI